VARPLPRLYEDRENCRFMLQELYDSVMTSF